MHYASKWGALICCLLAFASPAFAAGLSSKDDGVYVSEAFAEQALENRNVYQTGFDGALYVVVKDGRAQLSNAHEVWDANADERFEVKKPGEWIEFVPGNGKPVTYLKIREPDAAVYFFNQLFEGCYQDQQSNEICMRDNAITDKKALYQAELLLDSSELDIRGNNLKVEGEKLHWVLMPTARGWDVYRSDWASAEGYKPFDESKPWKKLTRIGDNP